MSFFFKMWVFNTVITELLAQFLMYYGVKGDRTIPELVMVRWSFALIVPIFVFVFLYLLSRTESKADRLKN